MRQVPGAHGTPSEEVIGEATLRRDQLVEHIEEIRRTMGIKPGGPPTIHPGQGDMSAIREDLEDRRHSRYSVGSGERKLAAPADTDQLVGAGSDRGNHAAT